MTKITYDDAVERAKKFWISYSQRPLQQHSPKAFDEEGGFMALSQTLIGADLILREPEKIIELASSSPQYFDTLRFGAARNLTNGVEMREPICLWIAGYLQGKRERPVANAGHPGKFGMQLMIIMAIDELVLDGWLEFRNDASSPASACDVVADALRDLGKSPSTYKSVKEYYLKARRVRKMIHERTKTDS